MSDSIEVIISTAGDTIEVVTQGPQGATGPTGPTGPAGSTTYGTTAGTACEGNDGRIATIGSGSIDTVGDSGTGGSINTGQINSGSGSPGDIDTGTSGDGVGGFIKTSALNSDGGYIDTRGYNYGSGGFINTSAGSQPGGSISTYDGGGSISTRGTGSIELGNTGTRTTLVGSAGGSNKTITLPNATGTAALTQQATDYEVTDATKGVIMKSPNGSRWRLTIDDSGILLRTTLVTLLLSAFLMCGAKAQVRDLVYGTNNVVIGPTNTNALAFTNSIAFSNPISFGTNAAATRTNLGVTVASNLPAPWSGGASSNSLLVSDGSGSSAFVSTIPRLTIASGTITNTNPALSISQTWSNSNSAFTGMLVNIANSNSATGSTIADFQTNGTSVVSVSRTGIGIAGSSWAVFSPTFGSAVGQSGVWYFNNQVAFGVASSLGTSSGAVQLSSGESFGWSSATQPYSASADLRLFRDTNDTLAQRRTTNPQTYNVYGSYTNSTNYRRLSVGMSNSGIAFIRPEQAGPLTNASNFIYISGLPATNTGLPSGVLWNSNGSVVVSP
jgi:hypothetical protein